VLGSQLAEQLAPWRIERVAAWLARRRHAGDGVMPG
jgi:hypothetical protein